MSLLLRGLSKEFMKEISARSREVYELMMPAVDMYEDGNELVVVMDLPGFEKDKIKTRLRDHFLVVSAKRDKEERDGVTYWEQRPVSISRKIPLPVKIRHNEDEEDVVDTKVTAKYDNGVLTVRLPIKDVGKIPVQ